jgi:3-dehydroquinate synthase
MTKVQNVRVRLARRKEEYVIAIGPGLLGEIGEHARRSLTPATRRIVLISNPTIFRHYGDTAIHSLRKAGFRVSHWLMRDGESHKTLRSLESALHFLTDAKLERHDALVALGGGVVGDLTGFAAAIYLRGIAYIQVPTTLLAQVDASVGGKTAVNSASGKNSIGAFYQPRRVVIDTCTLQTLPSRELTSGWCECIKQGAVGSRRLFDSTFRHLANGPAFGTHAADEQLAQLVAAHCSFKARIVAGDEREAVERTDHRSRRILNFGHSIAHALEFVTSYKRFRHGEAVGYGMLVAGELSKRLGILPSSDLESLCAAIHLAGRLPPANNIRTNAIIDALGRDKKSVGGHIQWVLLERLGRARIVDGHEVTPRVLRASVRAALQSIT